VSRSTLKALEEAQKVSRSTMTSVKITLQKCCASPDTFRVDRSTFRFSE